MARWTLTLGLQNLRRQINAAFPDRDKTSDGTIGDAAHRTETSGHNPDDTAGSRAEWNRDPDSTSEVRAWDMDSDLRSSVDAQALVDHLRRLPGLRTVIRYIIYDRRIYHERADFEPAPYTGASAHTEHVHFSGAWTQAADDDTSFDYRLEELPVALNAADKAWLSAEIRKQATAAVAAQQDEIAAAVRRTARTNAEFLSDTEKDELVDRISTTTAEKVAEIEPPAEA
jgi:hypothetical protein